MAKSKPIVAVTSTNPPYLYDTPNVLSLPRGAEFRFRYRSKWVQATLRQRSVSDRRRLKGTKVVLVFHSEQTGTLVPLREAIVVRLETLGPVVYLRFKAGRFFKSTADTTGWCRKLLALPEAADLKKPLPDEYYLRIGSTDLAETLLAPKVEPEEWWQVVSLIGKEPSLQRLPFFHVIGLAAEHGISNRWTWLSQGGRYRLRILEWSFPGERKPIARVECSCNPDLLVLEAASNLIVGPYDVVDFDFVATKRGKGQLTVELTTEGISDEKPEAPSATPPAPDKTPPKLDGWSQAFHITLPVGVFPSWWRLLIRFALGVAGAILYVKLAPGRSANDLLQAVALFFFVLAMGAFGEKAVSAGKDARELAKKGSD